ncbi:MAG: DNA polymerase III subunit beta [Gammaproteobacteria bacterium]
MQLTVQREALLEPLQMIIGVVERRQTLPIIGHVLLKIENNILTLTATDTEIELIGHVELAEPVTEQMEVTVPGRKFLDICRALDANAQLNIRVEKERLLIRAGSGRFVLVTLPASQFPKFEDSEALAQFTMEEHALNGLLYATHFAMAQQDIRYYLNGLSLEIKQGKVHAVATDGHRFALSHTLLTAAPTEPLQIIVPRKGVLELLRLLKPSQELLQITAGEHYIRIKGSTFTFTSKLIDARFPDYSRVMPSGKGVTLQIERETLRQALTRVALLSNDKVRVVQLSIRHNLLQIQATNPEAEEAEEILPIDYQGQELEIAFNVNYLLDVLNTTTAERIKLTILDATQRICIEGIDIDQSLYLVMPLQI